MRLLSIFLVLGAFILPPAAYSQVAAGTSDIPTCITLSPAPRFPNNPIGGYTVVVRDAAGVAVPGATVSVDFDPAAVPLISFCGGGGPPALLGVTAADGSITFDIFGAGCIDPADPAQACAIPPASVTVTGPVGVGGAFVVPIACIRSPDVVNISGAPASCPGTSTCVAARTGVGLSDAVYHTVAVRSGAVGSCSKMTPPFGGPVGLPDAVYLTPYIRVGSNCGC